MKTRVHISLEVSNLEKSVDFYSKLFKRPPSKNLADYANFRMESPDLHLSLVPSTQLEVKNSNQHFGVELFENDDLKSLLAEAQKQGLQTKIEEQVTCCYAISDKFWVQDPDGHNWEFWIRQADADQMFAAPKKEEASCCAPGCCA